MRRYSVLFLLLTGCAAGAQKAIEQIQTIVVVYAENRSFDHLFGLFPRAEAIPNAPPEHRGGGGNEGATPGSAPAAPPPGSRAPVPLFAARPTPDVHLDTPAHPASRPSGFPPAAGASPDLADPARLPAPPSRDK